ncbi:response regulator transcription factor [Pontiella agarivorans]|uniref:LuxR C-terminal-related transcriptional regulator n=1 Tax=Pontiella agarivorans TaxID=3038953 RepID=A0ABU5N0B2_9BACT|nr:LuxR C-terminal-related transcriptional regulator [Pontiella agarivorans]MDZ8119885.1 LuxR C-terminal-related transcriptional regulator [Pontiella agarivorans]
MENFTNAGYRNLSEADLQRTVKVCDLLHQANENRSFTKHMHAVLMQMFSNVHFSSELYQLEPFTLLEQELPTVDDRLVPIFKKCILDHPYASQMVSQTVPELSMTQLEPSMKELLKTALYNEFYSKVEAQNQIWIGLRDGNELLTGVYSRERKYSEKHRSMMGIILPHLELAWKHWKQTRSLKMKLGMLKDALFQSEEQEAVAARLRKAIDALPSRQREVIEQVAAGLDNQQIADELNISKRTVQKHLELIFRALEVHHRTELVAKWHKAHSIQLY